MNYVTVIIIIQLISNKNKSGIKQSYFLCYNVHANKAVQNTVEQNKNGGEVITGEVILRRRGRLYYDQGETLLRSRGDFLMKETISRDTGRRQLNLRKSKSYLAIRLTLAGCQSIDVSSLLFVNIRNITLCV